MSNRNKRNFSVFIWRFHDDQVPFHGQFILNIRYIDSIRIQQKLIIDWLTFHSYKLAKRRNNYHWRKLDIFWDLFYQPAFHQLKHVLKSFQTNPHIYFFTLVYFLNCGMTADEEKTAATNPMQSINHELFHNKQCRSWIRILYEFKSDRMRVFALSYGVK